MSSSDSSNSSPAGSPAKKVLNNDSDDDSDVSKPRSKSSSPVSSRSGGEETVKTVKKKKFLSDSESDNDDDDDDESKKNQKQKERSSTPDSTSEEKSAPRPNKADLFGDSSSSSDNDDEKEDGEKAEPSKRVRVGSGSDAESVNSIDQLHGIVMQNDEEEPEEEKERILNTESTLSSIQATFGEGPYFAKMPNFLSVSTHPFDPEYYEEDEDDDQTKLDEEGRNRLKLRVENTIRWRRFVDENGEDKIESNAKFIKWSDGTTSLYLGNEIFEVTMMPLNANNLPHLYARQAGGMAAQSLLQKRITFRPHSTDSQTHRKVTLNMADRSRKSGQVKVMDDVGHNPEIQRREAARKEEEAMRAHIRRTTMVRNTFKVRRPMGGNYSDEDEGTSRKSRGKKKEAPIIGASSDESDGERDSRQNKSDSDSDEEYRKRKQQPKKKTIVTSDEESD